MSKIGFLVVGHPDYPNDVALRFADRAAQELQGQGIELLYHRQPLTTPWEADETARQLLRVGDWGGGIIFIGTWIEAPVAVAAIRAWEHLPLAIWGYPMFENKGMRDSTGSSVGWAVVKAALDRVGFPCKCIVGPVDDMATVSHALSFCRAALAATKLRQARIGLVGYASMGMYSATFDHLLLRFRIGPEVEHADAYSVIRRAEAITHAELAPTLSRLREYRIAPGVREEQLEKAARVYLALKSWAEERHLDAIAFKCQYEFSQEYGMVGCVPLALLTQDGIVTSCEGDVMLALSMLTLHYLTGQEIYYGDVLDWVGQCIYLSSCGFVPYAVASSAEDIEIRNFPHPGFKGLCNSFTLKPGRMTWLRFSETVGGHFMHYGTGTGHATERRQGWAPAINLELEGDVREFIANLTSQHYAVCYGDLAEEIGDLARILCIPAKRI